MTVRSIIIGKRSEIEFVEEDGGRVVARIPAVLETYPERTKEDARNKVDLFYQNQHFTFVEAAVEAADENNY